MKTRHCEMLRQGVQSVKLVYSFNIEYYVKFNENKFQKIVEILVIGSSLSIAHR